MDIRDLVMEVIRTRKPLQDSYASLIKMLEQCKTEAFLKVCIKRIYDAKMFDNKDIMLDPGNPSNLVFTANGLVKAESILQSYVTKEKIDEVINALDRYNTAKQNVNHIAYILLKANRKTLRAISTGNYNGTSQIECDNDDRTNMEDIQILAAEELKQRRLSSIIKRKSDY